MFASLRSLVLAVRKPHGTAEQLDTLLSPGSFITALACRASFSASRSTGTEQAGQSL
jgi:hypothetical protein